MTSVPPDSQIAPPPPGKNPVAAHGHGVQQEIKLCCANVLGVRASGVGAGSLHPVPCQGTTRQKAADVLYATSVRGP